MKLRDHKPLNALRCLGLAAVSMLLLGGVPSSDSPDFFLNTTHVRADLSFADSDPFDIDTGLTFDTPGNAESPDFSVNTQLTFRRPRFADSRDFTLNTTLARHHPDYGESGPFTLSISGINRSWGDSEPFAVDDTGTGIPEHILLVAPSAPNVARTAGSTHMAVSNRGQCAMHWTASIAQGSPWLRITSGASGTNGGQIRVAYDANPNPEARTGIIRVQAPQATPNQVDVTLTQAGTASAPVVTHFEFSPLPGPYMVDEPIPVTITAVDRTNRAAGPRVQAAFRGCVDLSTNAPATVKPNKLCTQDGVLSGSILLDASFANMFLRADASGVVGVSNGFSVLSKDSARGRVVGRVITPGGDGVIGALVILHSLDNSFVREAITALSPPGEFKFRDLPPAEYTLVATLGESTSDRQSTQVAAGQTSGPVLLEIAPKDNAPVLLVGGMLGSTSKGFLQDLSAPTLHGRPGSPKPSDLALLDPPEPFYDIWHTLRIRLRLSGNFKVNDVPWDWRMRINIDHRPILDQDVVRKYLMDAIDRATKDPAGNTIHEKVHIVAHSLGGLLVRAYIEGDQYRGDIDRFAMVGTPNQGGAIVYYIWEGADPGLADMMSYSREHFYSNTIARLYPDARDSRYNEVDVFLVSDQKRWQFIHEYIPGLGDLVPTFPFLKWGGLLRHASIQVPQPRFLAELANSSGVNRLTYESGPSNLVRTKLFLGSGLDTLYAIPVASGAGTYSNGKPLSYEPPIRRPGDGTVLNYAKDAVEVGLVNISEVADQDRKTARHVDLMARYATEICTFLGGLCATVATEAEVARVEKHSVLQVSMTGRGQVYVTTGNGIGTGVNPETGEFEQGITRSSTAVSPGSAGISISDPSDGTYQLHIAGIEGDVFAVEITYAHANLIESRRLQGVYHDGVLTATTELNSADTRVLDVDGPLEQPTTLRSQRVNDLTRLLWVASPDPNATGYNVYARPDDQPKYALLGSTTATTFDADHPWNEGGGGQAWQYFVTAVSDDGKESFFIETVENRNPLIARLSADVTTGVEELTVTFTDASSGEVTSWAWDFEGDDVIDSTEQNPVHTFAEAGSYTVTLTVGGPEGTDSTIRTGYITVEPLVPEPEQVPGDFDGDRDVDLVDHTAYTQRMKGPFVDPSISGWHLFDLDPDYDVDLEDFSAFQMAFTGAGP